VSGSWNRVVKLHEVSRGPLKLSLVAGDAERAEIATAAPWLDGLELSGRFNAIVEQICGVSLEPFEASVTGDIAVRIVPAGSAHAPPPEEGDLEFDADSPDAPDVIADDAVDIAEYLVEHLSLELDPFPRKPGVTFDYAPPTEELSPFAALRKLAEPKA
jgi:hypothetical protein